MRQECEICEQPAVGYIEVRVMPSNPLGRTYLCAEHYDIFAPVANADFADFDEGMRRAKEALRMEESKNR